ncbi:MAG: hypothetical protein ACI4PP_05020 [Clostridia bacterium]
MAVLGPLLRLWMRLRLLLSLLLQKPLQMLPQLRMLNPVTIEIFRHRIKYRVLPAEDLLSAK